MTPFWCSSRHFVCASPLNFPENIKLVFNHALDHHCFTLHEYTENKTHTQTNTHNHNGKRDRNNDTMDNNRYNKKNTLSTVCVICKFCDVMCIQHFFRTTSLYTQSGERFWKKDKIRSAVTPTHAKKRSVVDGKPCSAHQYTRTVPVAFRSLDVVVWAKKKRPLTRLVQY